MTLTEVKPIWTHCWARWKLGLSGRSKKNRRLISCQIHHSNPWRSECYAKTTPNGVPRSTRSSPTTAEPVRGANKCRAWYRCFASWSLESTAPHLTPPTNILWVNNTPYVMPIAAIPSVEKTGLLPGTPWISRILLDAQTCSGHKLHRFYSMASVLGQAALPRFRRSSRRPCIWIPENISSWDDDLRRMSGNNRSSFS